MIGFKGWVFSLEKFRLVLSFLFSFLIIFLIKIYNIKFLFKKKILMLGLRW